MKILTPIGDAFLWGWLRIRSFFAKLWQKTQGPVAKRAVLRDSAFQKMNGTATIGICIYCGALDDLTDEHVIPFALGGRFVLSKASCRRCAKITSDFEMKVLRGFMHDARMVGSFPTRRPKERPPSISYEIKTECANDFEPIEIPLAESTAFLHLPKLQPPAFLNGRTLASGTIIVGHETITFGKNPHDFFSGLEAKEFKSTVNIDVPAFARMIAKMGYCYAVAEMGVFPVTEVPVLPMIVGTADDASSWVGSSPYLLPIEDRHPQHALGLTRL